MGGADRDLERFCAAAWPKLVAALSHQGHDVHVAEELVQEALIRACRRWEKVSGLESPQGWTYRVAVNLGTSVWRRRQAEQRARQRHGPDPTVSSPVAFEDEIAVRGALARLTDQQRDAVIMRFVLDLSVDQTGRSLAISPDAVRATTYRALQRLRELLGDRVDHPCKEATDAG